MLVNENIITANDGFGLRRKGDVNKSTVTTVSLADGDTSENWEDCEYGISEITDMKYSTLAIKRELSKLGKWESAKALLTASGYWDDYVLANYLKDTDEAFVAACGALVSQGIVTQIQLNSLLPLCVWTAD